ncbi:uncharacterized protein LAESUDRAFT_728147 [Laetiporus sulphureus 93-53]|uniref:Uncharacterized protein n=1 Tax=Laetiporus sulphureus 93-53 TaxID=1314785 RepID=A0A165D8E7_9APHY|nr:uncharacterized protein LAESUDRAFT_728147 [Laetiporus sulphureus 93-53]KZT04325.1 hypothetical protein LAESUDRAFT_728147 [Laetiporus sulphureus 93-53]
MLSSFSYAVWNALLYFVRIYATTLTVAQRYDERFLRRNEEKLHSGPSTRGIEGS